VEIVKKHQYMKWFRNIFDFNKEHVKSSLEISVEKLLESFEEIKDLKKVIERSEESLKDIENSLDNSLEDNYHKITVKIEKHLSEVQNNLNSGIDKKVSKTEDLIISKLENRHLIELEEIKSQTKIELDSITKEVSTVLEILRPKPVSIDFKLVDPLNETYEVFLFKKANELSQVQNKQKVKDGRGIISSLMGSIPGLTAISMLTNSYRFDFPHGLNSQVMQMGSGQGTALMQNGKIIAHGSYVSNALIAAPLAVFGIANMIVRQHYLNKIHERLSAIEASLDTLIKLVFIDKRAKIDSIIYFFKKSLHEFDHISSNQNYRNAILTNIVSKNIEIYELIQFYGNSIHQTLNYNNDKNGQLEDNMKSFLLLQDLFLHGKVLSFMYSNLHSKKLTEDINIEISDLLKFYIEVFEKNKEMISSEFNINSSKWNDWLRHRKGKKERIRNTTTQDLLSIDSIKRNVEENFINGQNIINDLLFQIEKPQHFLIEEGELYQIN